MEPNILKRIFFDEHRHWDRFVEKHKGKLRPGAEGSREIPKLRKDRERIQAAGVRRMPRPAACSVSLQREILYDVLMRRNGIE